MADLSKYDGIINTATVSAGAIGVPGAFSAGLDKTAVLGIWTTMIVAIAAESGHELDKAAAAKLASGCLTGMAAYLAGSVTLTTVLHFIPGIGTLTAVGLNSGLNALYTRKVGYAVAEMFEREEYAFSADTQAAVMSFVKGVAGVHRISHQPHHVG